MVERIVCYAYFSPSILYCYKRMFEILLHLADSEEAEAAQHSRVPLDERGPGGGAGSVPR